MTATTLTPALNLTFRIGFAGNRDAAEATVTQPIRQVISAIAERLAQIHASRTAGNRITRFYSAQAPLVRLITGLAEGADAIAFKVFESFDKDQAPPSPVTCEWAAVIPFSVDTYRDSRQPDFRAEFNRQAARCAYILALDGKYLKPDPDTGFANSCRARAYRAQAEVLLRHSDLLIAVADPKKAGAAGGTMETVRNALDFGLPVVFINAMSGVVQLIEPADHLPTALDPFAPKKANVLDWAPALDQLIEQLVADPDVARDDAEGAVPAWEYKFIEDYFSASTLPPMEVAPDSKRVRKKTLREGLWDRLMNRVKASLPRDQGAKDASLAAYDLWRDRARNLDYHYAGLYRGSILVNYLFAALAGHGIKGVESAAGWHGLLAPAGTPPAVIARLHSETMKILAMEKIRDRIVALGAEPASSRPEELATLIARDIERLGPVVRKTGATLD